MEAKFKVGDKAMVVGNSSKHEFKINEDVTVVGIGENNITLEPEYVCKNNHEVWYVNESELEPIEPIDQINYQKEYERLRQLYEPSGFKAGELVAFSHTADFTSAVVTNYQSFDDEMHYCCDNYSYRYAMSWSQFVELKNTKQ